MTDTTGTFITDEPLILNGIQEPVTVTSVREYSLGDVKSLHQNVGVNTFTADLELTSRFSLAPNGTNFTISTGGVVTVPGNRFVTGIKTGDIVSYNISGFSTDTFNRVSSIASDGSTITLSAIDDRNGICDGNLPGSELQTSDLTLIRPQILNARDSKLITRLPERYISSVDVSDANLEIRRQYTLNIASGRGTVTVEDLIFSSNHLMKKEQSLFSDGTIEALTRGNLVFNDTFKTVTLRSLSKTTDTNAILIATLKKINAKSNQNLTRQVSWLSIDPSMNTLDPQEQTLLTMV